MAGVPQDETLALAVALDSVCRGGSGGLPLGEFGGDGRPAGISRYQASILFLCACLAVVRHHGKDKGDELQHYRRRDGIEPGSLLYSAGAGGVDCELDKVA